MNVFFVMKDGTMVTPPLKGTILPGITRASVIELSRERGMKVEERPYTFEEWKADTESGRLQECFACGTAAVLAGIGTVKHADGAFTIGHGETGEFTTSLREQLVGIQKGATNDQHGWSRVVGL